MAIASTCCYFQIAEVVNVTEEKYLLHLESGRKVMEKALTKMNIAKNMTGIVLVPSRAVNT
jgi:hypothetical protein